MSDSSRIRWLSMALCKSGKFHVPFSNDVIDQNADCSELTSDTLSHFRTAPLYHSYPLSQLLYTARTHTKSLGNLRNNVLSFSIQFSQRVHLAAEFIPFRSCLLGKCIGLVYEMRCTRYRILLTHLDHILIETRHSVVHGREHLVLIGTRVHRVIIVVHDRT